MFEKNKDLTPYTTFGIPAKAALFAEYSSREELLKISRTPEFTDNEVLHIGGGSNLLFVNDFNGLVLHSAITGIEAYRKDSDTVYVIAGAGVKWTDLVDWCVCSGYAGLENLAGIPGEVGASAVQNVGAYGVEAKDVIHSVECFDTLTRAFVRISNEECRFDYRDSRFKHDWKGRFIVVRVSFRLSPSDIARCLDYGPLRALAADASHPLSIREVAQEVVRIRNTKLPDPAQTGSAGSFFKNPVVSRYFYREAMCALETDIPCYPVWKDSDLQEEGKESKWVKVPAGWLIEHSGLKGIRIGGAEVYPKQCLVIANAGGASARDVVALSRLVINKVMEKFAVVLEPEVNFIDTDIDITILGSGTSKGVPEVGCACKVCRSESGRDKRLRASALVRTHGLDLLIDVSPDFREQALREDITRIDAALLTHSHYDHVGGIDDLRPFCAHRDLPIYLKEDVNQDLHKRLDYCFRHHLYPGVPKFEMHEIGDKPFFINGLRIIPIHINHGKLPILGYRIGSFAYITDAKTIPEEELEKLEGLDVLVINALRHREHFSHLSVGEALKIIGRIKPKEAFLTHFCHEIGLHEDFEKTLPPNVHPCFDGLRIHISAGRVSVSES